MSNWENDEKEREYYLKTGEKQIKDAKSIINDTLERRMGDKWFYEFLTSLRNKNGEFPQELLESFWKVCKEETECFDWEEKMNLPLIREMLAQNN